MNGNNTNHDATITPNKETGENIYRPFSKLCFFLAWVTLIAGIGGFLFIFENNKAIAVQSLVFGVISFVVTGVLGEISTHLAFIRGQLKIDS